METVRVYVRVNFASGGRQGATPETDSESRRSMWEFRANFCAVVCHRYINNTKHGFKQFPTNVTIIVVTRCHILRCTKFDFGWGSAPDPAEALTVLPQTL